MSSTFFNNNNTRIQPVRGNKIKAQAFKSLGRTLVSGASKATAALRRIARGGGYSSSGDSNSGGGGDDDGGPSSGVTSGSTTPSVPYDNP